MCQMLRGEGEGRHEFKHEKACLVPILQASATRGRDKNELNIKQNNICTKSLCEYWGGRNNEF